MKNTTSGTLAPSGTLFSKVFRKPLSKRYFEKRVPKGAKVPPRCHSTERWLVVQIQVYSLLRLTGRGV